MAAKRLVPKFRDPALGEKYYAIHKAFTGVAVGTMNIIEMEPQKPEIRQIDDVTNEIDIFWDTYEKTVKKFEDRIKTGNQTQLTEEEQLMVKALMGQVRGRATDEDIKNRDHSKIPTNFRNALETIKSESMAAEYAVYEALSMAAERIKALPAMQKTAEDILDARRVFLREYDPKKYSNPLDNLRPDEIPIFENASHGDIADLLDKNGELRVKAAYVDDTTSTSHAVLKAKQHGLLFVWSPDGQRPPNMRDGMPVIIDGDEDVIVLGASAETLKYYNEKERRYNEGYELLKKKWKKHRKVISPDGREYKNYINADTPNSAKLVKEYGAQGIGLVRLEEYLGSLKPRERHLTSHQWYQYIDDMVKNSDRGTIVFRLLDAIEDKQMDGFTQEIIDESDQRFIEAFLQYRNDHPTLNLELMPPNIETAEQLAKYQLRVDITAESLGVQSYLLGSMDENPQFNDDLEAEKFLESSKLKLSFISVGANDMTAKVLGINRFDKEDESKNDNSRPEVLRELQRPILYQRDIGGPDILPVSNCGDMPSQPARFALLSGMGYRRLSMAPALVPIIKELESRIDSGYRFRALRTENPEEYERQVALAQQDDEPSNAWALYHRVVVEEDDALRHEIIAKFNEEWAGLDRHNRIDLNWKPKENRFDPNAERPEV